MINRLHKHKSTLAITLLLVFASLFVCAFLCDFDIYSFSQKIADSDKKHLDHQQSINEGHNHSSHEHDHHSKDHLGTSSHEHHSDTEGQSPEECCDDLRFSVFSSLIKQNSENLLANGNFYVLYTTHFPIYEFNYVTRFGKNILLRYVLPPPIGGFDLRILLQSFLN